MFLLITYIYILPALLLFMFKKILFSFLVLGLFLLLIVSSVSARQDPIIAINGDWCLGADVNKDGRVALDDKNIVSAKYGKKDCSNLNVFCDGADINRDGKVSISDLTSVTSYYGLYGCCARASYGGRCMDSLFCPLYREPQKNLYDDFSSGVLDSNKWVARNFRSEGFIDLTEDGGVYHMALDTPLGGELGFSNSWLYFNRDFSPGDIIELDVNYVSGGGGRHHFRVGGTLMVIGVLDNNGVSIGFTENGLYHVKVEFLPENNLNIVYPELQYKVTFTDTYGQEHYSSGAVDGPDNFNLQAITDITTATYHFDIDNVYIYDVDYPFYDDN